MRLNKLKLLFHLPYFHSNEIHFHKKKNFHWDVPVLVRFVFFPGHFKFSASMQVSTISNFLNIKQLYKIQEDFAFKWVSQRFMVVMILEAFSIFQKKIWRRALRPKQRRIWTLVMLSLRAAQLITLSFYLILLKKGVTLKSLTGLSLRLVTLLGSKHKCIQ